MARRWGRHFIDGISQELIDLLKAPLQKKTSGRLFVFSQRYSHDFAACRRELSARGWCRINPVSMCVLPWPLQISVYITAPYAPPVWQGCQSCPCRFACWLALPELNGKTTRAKPKRHATETINPMSGATKYKDMIHVQKHVLCYVMLCSVL